MNQKQKLAIFDIDGTIFRKNLHFEVIDELVYMKIFPKSVRDELVNLYGHWLNHEGSYDDYRDRLVRLYEEHIAGCKQDDVEKAAKKVASFNARRIYIFTRDLIEELKKDHIMLVISGSPVEIVKDYAEIFDFDAHYGSVYEIDKNGFYTGKTIFEPTKDKGAVVKQFVAEQGIELKGSIGVGDTESDASFLDLVDTAIAFNPNSNLRTIAQEKDWRIVVEKKDIVYEL